MAIQDQNSSSRTQAQVQEKEEPWWVGGFYWPGAVLVLVAGILFAVAPWVERTAQVCGTATTLVLVGALITLLYGFKWAHYDELEKAKNKARADALSDWQYEQRNEHCKDHCRCGACQAVQSIRRAALKG